MGRKSRELAAARATAEAFPGTVLAVDAMGGDNAPSVVLEGVAAALEADPALKIVLCGPDEVVTPFAANHERCEARATTQVIDMGEHPARAVRQKKDSSIVVGCRLVKEGQAAGFFSAGSTGACLAAATLVVGRVKGVQRPALAMPLPAPSRPVLLCDVGANADCKPAYLVQFARMAGIYAERILGIPNPRIGLLNIGEEEEKGNDLAIKTHALMAKQVPGFAGNAEGRDILTGDFDVVVCDGFTGNVTLKTIEGTSKVLFKMVKEAMMSSAKAKIGALALKSELYELKDRMSADTYGGAPLLGCKGAVVVGHGSSNAKAVKNGILVTARAARENVSEIIAQTLAGSDASNSEQVE